jgi:hypothetical protein
MDTLPIELLIFIADYLPLPSLFSLSLTCHSLHHLLAPRLIFHVPARASRVLPCAARTRRYDLLKAALPYAPGRYTISPADQRGLLSDLMRAGEIELMRKLLERRDVNPNGTNGGLGPTPLVEAMLGRDFEAMEVLIDSGASVWAGGPPAAIRRRRWFRMVMRGWAGWGNDEGLQKPKMGLM